MRDTKAYPLIVGLLVPVLMVVFIAGTVFIPRFFAPLAQYDFIYSVPDGYNPEIEYRVVNGKIIIRDLKRPIQNQYSEPYASVRLYRHYVKENRSADISLEEAKRFIFSNATRSPDGFEISPGSQGSSFLFFFYSSPDYNEMYLKGHGVGRELNLVRGRGQYYSYLDFHFVGWILS